MSICIDAWRAAIGSWHNHQCSHPLNFNSPTKSFFTFHTLLSKPSSIDLLTLYLICYLLLLCGDIHLNPGPPPKTPTSTFTFCHLNTRSLPTINDTGPRLHHIEQEFTIDNHYDLIAMTETHLSPQISDTDISISNYQLFRKDRNRHGGGVCIYVSNSFPVTRLDELDQDNAEILWLKLNIDNKIVYFGVCYRPPGQTNQEKTEFLDILESHLDQLLPLCNHNKSLILTGDFNDKTTDWHSPHYDSELGSDLYNLFNSFYLSQLIDEPTRNGNLLDLLITSNPRLVTNSGVIIII